MAASVNRARFGSRSPVSAAAIRSNSSFSSSGARCATSGANPTLGTLLVGQVRQPESTLSRPSRSASVRAAETRRAYERGAPLIHCRRTLKGGRVICRGGLCSAAKERCPARHHIEPLRTGSPIDGAGAIGLCARPQREKGDRIIDSGRRDAEMAVVRLAEL